MNRQMNFQFLFIFMIFISISCNSSQEVERQGQSNRFDKEKIQEQEKKAVKQLDQPISKELEVKFDLYSILITELDPGRALPRLLDQNEDTIFLESFLSVNLSSLKFKVIPTVKYERIIIEQKFENALTLNYGEQRRVDLKKWWDIDTEWKRVELQTNLTFKILPYNQKRRRDHLRSEFEEIKSEALKYPGDFVTEKDTDATRLEDFPLGIWASNCFIRLTIDLKDGQKIEKYLLFKQLYGC